MDEPNELPGKESPEIEEPKPEKSVPGIKTPPPPQVIDPSAPPDMEMKGPATTAPGKRKRIVR